MKKIIVLMLVTGITVNLCAQEKQPGSNTDKIFEPPLNSITRHFIVDLGKGNTMQLELSAFENIKHLKNIDSLLKMMLHDLQPFKDSLNNDLLAKRIDYVTDAKHIKKIRLQQYPAKGASFLAGENDIAALKIEQDTVYLCGIVDGNSTYVFSKKQVVSNYYRVGFFINQLSDLNNSSDWDLNEKISTIQKTIDGKWTKHGNSWLIRNGDPAISAKGPGGYIAGKGDYLTVKAGAGLQNYKNYFTPSFSIGATAYINGPRNKYDIGLAWEPHFLFARNNAGALQTFRNDFITLTLGREPVHSTKSNEDFHFDFFQHISLGYLVRRKADFIDQHSFRLGTGAIDWKDGKIKLEPVFYFQDFFRSLTPGLRLAVNF